MHSCNLIFVKKKKKKKAPKKPNPKTNKTSHSYRKSLSLEIESWIKTIPACTSYYQFVDTQTPNNCEQNPRFSAVHSGQFWH